VTFFIFGFILVTVCTEHYYILPVLPFSVFNGGAGQVVRRESIPASLGNGRMESNSRL
jgi:hypothetical protein